MIDYLNHAQMGVNWIMIGHDMIITYDTIFVFWYCHSILYKAMNYSQNMYFIV